MISNFIISINDSIVTVGKPRMFASASETKQIRIKDIQGFRKISVGSQLLKTALTIGATIGTYYAIRNNGESLSYTEQLLYSTAAGLTVRFTLSKVFPDEKVKYRIKDGWYYIVR